MIRKFATELQQQAKSIAKAKAIAYYDKEKPGNDNNRQYGR